MARPDGWSHEDKNWLAENYSNLSWDELTKNLCKTKSEIASKAAYIGVSRINNSHCIFTEVEDELIKKYLTRMSQQDFINRFMPYRTVSSIRTRASKLGVLRRNKWTNAEVEFLKVNFKKMNLDKLSEGIPNHSRNAIHAYSKKIGLSGGVAFKYSEADILYIEENYKVKSDKEIAEALFRAPQSIKECRRKLKFYRKDPNEPTHYVSIDQFTQRNNSEWKKSAMDVCDYRCVLTGEPFENIHHLFAKNLIIKAALQQVGLNENTNINDCDEVAKEDFLEAFYAEQSKYPKGVCLAKDTHVAFHNLYGYGYNTPEQFYEFVEKYFPDKLSIIKSIK